MAVAVGVFGYEEIVADQERRLHRAGRDIEGLKQEGADHKRDDQRVKDHASGLGNAAFFPLGSIAFTLIGLWSIAIRAPRPSSRCNGRVQRSSR